MLVLRDFTLLKTAVEFVLVTDDTTLKSLKTFELMPLLPLNPISCFVLLLLLEDRSREGDDRVLKPNELLDSEELLVCGLGEGNNKSDSIRRGWGGYRG